MSSLLSKRLDEESTSTADEKDESVTYLVDWDVDDSQNPRNWSSGYKTWITFQLSMLALAASLGSSIISPAEKVIAKEINISIQADVLSVSLYIIGFAFGPLCWAPVSEIWGRRWGMLPAMFCLGVLSVGTASSRTAVAVLITRFFSGIFGSAPVSNVAAALGDIWHPNRRGVALTFYSVAVTGGPTLGPIIGSVLVVTPGLGWQWTEYVEAFCVFSTFLLCLVSLPETYHPVLLKMKAQRMRQQTGNDKLYHPQEFLKLDFKSIMTKHLCRPLVMLVTEPMVTCMALYASFVYAMLYFTLQLFPLVYEELRKLDLRSSTLAFLGLFLGIVASVFINLANQPYYIRKVTEANGKPVPEARLPPMVLGGVLFTAGLFWFGWTAAPRYSWYLPTSAAVLIGAGFNAIFQQCINLLVDTYGQYSASATSANTFLRSMLAAGLPFVATPMVHNLGIGPAMSVLGGIAAVALPVPFIFMRYGAKLRKMSKFIPVEE